MRCDICDTLIPPGSNECPKCGYKYKKKHVIKSSTMEFDHIEEETKIPFFDHIETNKKIPTFDYIKPVTKRKQKLNYDKLITAIAILFICYVVFNIIISIIMG